MNSQTTSYLPGQDPAVDPAGKTPVGPNTVTGNNPISSSSLIPQTPIPYATPNTPPPPNTQGLLGLSTPQLQITPGQQNQSDLSQQLESLNNQMTGKSQYQSQLQQQSGYSLDANGKPINQSLTDLQGQLKMLTDQANNLPGIMQTDATGKGVTVGGLSSTQMALSRKLSSDASGVASLIAGQQNHLGLAQSLVNQAVDLKYKPIQDQIDAATKNLDLMAKDPTNTIAEKNQIQAQQDAQANQQAALDKQKQNSLDVLNAAKTAAANGADAKTLQDMQAAPDGASALRIATAAGFGTGIVADTAKANAAAVIDLTKQYPDAGIKSTDTVDQANSKILGSKSYTTAQKVAALDVLQKQSTIALTNSEIAKNNAAAAQTASDKTQQALEKNYSATLLRELSNRAGGLGLQDQKVNQAIHLKALIDQYTATDSSGNVTYNVPKAQYAELVLGLATLLSPSGNTDTADRQALMSKTAAGDINGALQYITGTPQNGNTQDVIKNLVDSIARQGTVAQQLRDQDVQFLHGLAPTDLAPDRVAALEKNTLSNFVQPAPTVGGTVDATAKVPEGTTGVNNNGQNVIYKNGAWVAQ